MTNAEAIQFAIVQVTNAIDGYRFVVQSEADLQEQLVKLLAKDERFAISREVIAQRGRYDIHVQVGEVRLVLELKLRASAAEVERQAQRYAMTDGVDAVLLVTTSSRLAAQLRQGGGTLAGKPFVPVALRGF